MNRSLLMSASAAAMGLAGLAATFLPKEILRYAGAAGEGIAPLLVQLLGALYIAFAMVNWMGRGNLIGGIYGRPIAMGNTLHFTMGALALVKGVAAGAADPPVLAALAAYAVFSFSFCLVLFTHPAKEAPAP